MANLDRFAQGRPDPQDAVPVAVCEACGEDIYPGEYVYQLEDGTILHEEWECLVRYIDPEVKTVEEALGVGA